MELLETRDRSRIEAFLRRDSATHIYALADLDELFWDDTTWLGAEEDGELRALALLLEKLRIPILYAVAPEHEDATRALLQSLGARLPERFFVNLGHGLESIFAPDHDFEIEGDYRKYVLPDTSELELVDTSAVEILDARHRGEIEAFLRDDAYTPEEQGGRFLEPYMVERWPTAAIRENGRIVCTAGTHVFSARYRVAAIGNIATRPDCRGQGLAAAATARLCRELWNDVDHLGLNVETTNLPAVRCYEGLGFRVACHYLEGTMTRRSHGRVRAWHD